jgi:putative membrane protein
MTTVPAAQPREGFRNSRLLQGLLGWYVLLWVALAISPFDRRDWFLENILALLLVGTLLATYRMFPFSDLSYVLITLFLTLHAVGAYYTYAEVPLGFGMKSLFGLERNHFDRVAHLAFGLLLTYPIRELLVRKAHVQRSWTYVIPVVTLLALSGFFEIIESWVAQIVSPELGDAYLGTQGDIWDAQKDMTAAFSGALLSMGFTRYGRAAGGEMGPRS